MWYRGNETQRLRVTHDALGLLKDMQHFRGKNIFKQGVTKDSFLQQEMPYQSFFLPNDPFLAGSSLGSTLASVRSNTLTSPFAFLAFAADLGKVIRSNYIFFCSFGNAHLAAPGCHTPCGHLFPDIRNIRELHRCSTVRFPLSTTAFPAGLTPIRLCIICFLEVVMVLLVVGPISSES